MYIETIHNPGLFTLGASRIHTHTHIYIYTCIHKDVYTCIYITLAHWRLHHLAYALTYTHIHTYKYTNKPIYNPSHASSVLPSRFIYRQALAQN